MCNTDSTIGENIRYFIYKYDSLYDDWFRDLNRIYVKLDAHVHSITNVVSLAEIITNVDEVDLIMFNSISNQYKKAIKIILMLFS